MYPKARYALSATAVGILSLAISAEAAMYACRDSRGRVQYTNVPSTSSCAAVGKNSNPQPRRTWTPPAAYNASSFDREIWAAGNRYDVDPYLIKAIIRAESDFNSSAVSGKGAQGLMQLMPDTARELRVRDPFNPRDNIQGGTRYFKRMLDTFGGDVVLSLAAYNAGPGTVKRAGGVPRIPETLNYVVKVLKHYQSYRQERRS